MQNSFEKQVQEKMDGLEFVPTEPVWMNIEKQIRIKKDRRRFVLWLPFVFLLSGGAWWMIAQNQNADRPAGAAINSEAGMNTIGEKQKEPAPGQNTVAKGKALVTGHLRPGGKQVSATDKPGQERAFHHTPAFVKSKKQKASSTASATAFIKTPTLNNEKTGPKDAVSGVLHSMIRNSDSVSLRKTDSALNKIHAGKDSTALYKVAETKPDSTNARVAEVAKKAAPRASKWQFGISVNGGISGPAKNFGSFSEEKSLRDAFAAPGNGTPPPAYDPSPVKNNFSFSAGVIAQKELTKRLSFSTGLQYSYYSTRIAVGQMRRQDTVVFASGFTQSVSRFYLNSGSHFTDYQNRYHFIAIPFSVDWKVLRSAPLHLRAGLSVQHLIHTNALLFDKGSRIYYADKAAFNKTQLFSNFGLSYAVLERGKTSLLLGPQLQYGISDLEKNSSGRHLFSLALAAQLLFNKN